MESQLEFTPIDLSQIETFKQKYLKSNPSQLCDWTVGGIFMWRDYFKMKYAEYKNTLILQLDYFKITSFTFMMDENYEEVLHELKKYCHIHEIPFVLCLVEENFLEKLRSVETCLHEKVESDWFDYVYDIESLRTYRGKKYATQRNHVNAFHKQYTNDKVVVGDIDPSLAKEFLDTFYQNKEIVGPIELEEKVKTYEVFTNQSTYQFHTIGLYIDDKLVGLASGEVIGDTVYEHIEKALDQYDGIYPVLSQAFAQSITDENVKYVNKEEDCGDMGLRYSKEKYRPIKKIEKHTVEICHRGLAG